MSEFSSGKWRGDRITRVLHRSGDLVNKANDSESEVSGLQVFPTVVSKFL